MKKAIFTFFILLFTQFYMLQSSLGQESKKYIALLMPSDSIDNVNISVKVLKNNLEQRGYKCIVAFAKNDAAMQNSQIEDFISRNVALLIINAVDENSLSKTLSQAKQKGVKIIAYDKFIKDAPINCYVAFDAFKIGVLEGKIIERSLGLNIQQKGPFYFEIFSDLQGNFESELYYLGAMSVFSPYFAKNRLRNISGEFSFKETATKNLSDNRVEFAKERMERLLSKFYSSKKLDAVLCADDSLALGVISALKKANYKKNGDKKDKVFPIITGQNCQRENIKAIINGEQTASVFKDYRILAERTAKIADALLSKKQFDTAPQVNYKYADMLIPAFLLEAKIIYKNDIQQEIFNSGYYKKSDILKIK